MNLLNGENLRSLIEKTSGLRADSPTKGRGPFFPFFPEPRFAVFKMGPLFLSSDNAVGPPEEATPRGSAALWQVPSALSTAEASGVGLGGLELSSGLANSSPAGGHGMAWAALPL